ncbi:hypothetical protein LD13_gp102 [Bacillus phage Bobb]|uniref:Uncharacterized protein n=1 Tax=Bacillus phage Bobb TaxID=1527469 RepID=A0A076G8T3_9CAUD|nr:hypothetical protein LD13_gp102 [Bacillus phage Bobb]AII28003.1 hypothetical protein [Bacillus phage Bobb]
MSKHGEEVRNIEETLRKNLRRAHEDKVAARIKIEELRKELAEVRMEEMKEMFPHLTLESNGNFIGSTPCTDGEGNRISYTIGGYTNQLEMCLEDQHDDTANYLVVNKDTLEVLKKVVEDAATLHTGQKVTLSLTFE